ncbi:MAG: alpha/beta hydrolase-fold protein [Verrucomicrobiota bacterium]
MNKTAPVLGLSLMLTLGSIESIDAQQKSKKEKPTPPPFSWSNPPTQWQLENNRIPKGVSHHTFKSTSMDEEVGYFIYLPEAYETETDRDFPVVFHLHGGRPGSEAKSHKLATFVDKAISSGDIQPTLYVFPNGGPMSWYNYPQIPNGFGEDVLVKELIPHIKATYRTRELAIEGFSQGGRGTTRIMFRHPDLFVSAAPGGSGYEPEKRISDNNGAESEKVVFAPRYNAWDLAEDYAMREDRSGLPILLWVGTAGFNYEYNLKFSDHLKSLEIPHEMLIADDVDHSAMRYYEKEGTGLMQFHQRYFAQP